MEEGKSKGRTAGQIDYPILWVAVRGTQILLTVIYAKFAYLSWHTDSFISDLISIIIFLSVFGAFLHPLATGTADSFGVHYRRYFRLKTVTWADIQEIQWVGYRLRVLIRSKGKRKRKIIFLLNPLKSTGAYWANRLGAEAALPEILERINALPIETPPAMASAPPYPKWVLRWFSALVVLLLLVMLWRLLTTLSQSPH